MVTCQSKPLNDTRSTLDIYLYLHLNQHSVDSRPTLNQHLDWHLIDTSSSLHRQLVDSWLSVNWPLCVDTQWCVCKYYSNQMIIACWPSIGGDVDQVLMQTSIKGPGYWSTLNHGCLKYTGSGSFLYWDTWRLIVSYHVHLLVYNYVFWEGQSLNQFLADSIK